GTFAADSTSAPLSAALDGNVLTLTAESVPATAVVAVIGCGSGGAPGSCGSGNEGITTATKKFAPSAVLSAEMAFVPCPLAVAALEATDKRLEFATVAGLVDGNATSNFES